MTKKPKLSTAQFDFLSRLLVGPQTAVEAYKPAHKLVEIGFATAVAGNYNVEFTITDAGRAPAPNEPQDAVHAAAARDQTWNVRAEQLPFFSGAGRLEEGS